MHARPGEVFVTKGHYVGGLDRDARILGVRASSSQPPGRVGWSVDGCAVLVNPCHDVYIDDGGMR